MHAPDQKNPGMDQVLMGLRRRQRLLNALRWGVNGLLIGGAAACLGATIAWAALEVGLVRVIVGAAACVLTGGLVGILVGLSLPVSDLEVARALDRAAASEDRFASALQLTDHHQRSRARLVLEDALARVRGTSPAAALPVRVPRTARWLPLPLALVAAVLVLIPQADLQATAGTAPEISAEEWGAIHQEFADELAKLPKALTPEEEELQKQMDDLAAKLGEKPEKKDALKEIARLSERVEKQRQALGARAVSMKNAAKAMASSQTLKSFAAKLKEGAYTDAAGELRKTAKELKEGALSPDGEEFENMAADLQKLAEQVAAEKELEEACQKCAGAASKMSREALAEALKRLAEQMEKNAGQCQQGDRFGQYKKMLEELKRRMNQGQCQGDKEGDGFCQNPGMGTRPGKFGAKKGGLKAGWGSAAKWDGGALSKDQADNAPELTDTLERPGATTTFPIVSPDERAKSGLTYEQLFAEFVQKTEADLDLESVPVAYREFLRRYFNAIRPPEHAPADNAEEPAKP